MSQHGGSPTGSAFDVRELTKRYDGRTVVGASLSSFEYTTTRRSANHRNAASCPARRSR